MVLNEKGVIRHVNNTYCKANKSCDEIIEENIEYLVYTRFYISYCIKYKTFTLSTFGLQNNRKRKTTSDQVMDS